MSRPAAVLLAAVLTVGCAPADPTTSAVVLTSPSSITPGGDFDDLADFICEAIRGGITPPEIADILESDDEQPAMLMAEARCPQDLRFLAVMESRAAAHLQGVPPETVRQAAEHACEQLEAGTGPIAVLNVVNRRWFGGGENYDQAMAAAAVGLTAFCPELEDAIRLAP